MLEEGGGFVEEKRELGWADCSSMALLSVPGQGCTLVSEPWIVVSRARMRLSLVSFLSLGHVDPRGGDPKEAAREAEVRTRSVTLAGASSLCSHCWHVESLSWGFLLMHVVAGIFRTCPGEPGGSRSSCVGWAGGCESF